MSQSEAHTASQGADHAAAAHHHDDVPHGTRRGYLTGFALSVVLTVIPFALVMGGGLPANWTVAVCMICAIVQIVVHMVYFLHMNGKAEGGWTMMALIFTGIITVIAIAGTIWVMHHMNANMMPDMAGMGGQMANMSGGM